MRGKGGDWEGALITQELYDARSRTLKFVPVLFDADQASFVPEPLRSLTHYTLDSKAGYDKLCEFLGGVAGVEPRPVRRRTPKTRRQVDPLTFGGAADESQWRCQLLIATHFLGDDFAGCFVAEAFAGAFVE